MTRGRYVTGEDINRVNRLAIEQKERIAALEAAARDLIAACHPGKQHMPWTQLAALAALLEEDKT